MKKISFASILIFIVSLLVLLFACNLNGYAYADVKSVCLSKINAKDSNGNNIIVNEQTWASGVSVDFSDFEMGDFYKYQLSSTTGYNYSSDYIQISSSQIGSGIINIPVQNEGMITVTITIYTYNSLTHAYNSESSTTAKVWVDNSGPREPDVDTSTLDEYHITPFDLSYQLATENYSGLDYYRSTIAFVGKKSEDSIGATNIATLIPVLGNRDQIQFLNITGAGTLIFDLYDNAGNHSSFSYEYTKYGVPENGEPQIAFSTQDYATEVVVTISWGEGYDDNPYAFKRYALLTSAGPIPKEYTGPITINTEGEVELIVYYYEDGEEKSLSRIINNIDKTSPSLSIMQSYSKLVCNIASEEPLILKIKAEDGLSGISKVYIKDTNEEFSPYIGEIGYYYLPIKKSSNYQVVAEDNAGNKSEFVFFADYVDYQTLEYCNSKYLELNPDNYTKSANERLNALFNEMSIKIIDQTSSTSDIASLKQSIDTAIQGEIKIVNRILNVPGGLEGGFVYNLQAQSTDAKKGETIAIILDNANNSGRIKSAKSICGISNPNTYSFLIKLEGETEKVNLIGNMVIKIRRSNLKSDSIKCYIGDGDGVKEVLTLMDEEFIYISTTSLGDFYICAESQKEQTKGLIIGGRLYSTKLLLITAGIIVGICAVGFVATYMILKIKRGRE